MTAARADLALAYRLLCAANLAYGVADATDSSGSLAATPPVLPDTATIEALCSRLGWQPATLNAHQSASRDGIDAFLYGETAEAAILAFRGTLPLRQTGRLTQILNDWLNNTRALLVAGQPLGLPGEVHAGYAESLENLWHAPGGIAGLLERIAKAVAGGRRFWLTGHSKGGALATLAAMKLAGAGVRALKPAGIHTFGAPQTGNRAFATAYEQTFPGQSWRFECQDDIVPHLPPSASLWLALKTALGRRIGQAGEWSWSSLTAETLALIQESAYATVGQLHFIDWGGQLRIEDTAGLRAERWRRLALALTTALPELNRDHLPMRGYGYMDFLEAARRTGVDTA